MGSAASSSVKVIEVNKENRLAPNSRPETPVKSAPRQSPFTSRNQSVLSKLPDERRASSGKQQRTTPASKKEKSQVAGLEMSGQEEFPVQGSMLQAASLEKQVAELESEKLDLQDRIMELQERLLYAQLPPTPNYHGQDLQQKLSQAELRISQLGQELSVAHTQADMQIGKLRRKVKKLTSQLTAAKQEASIRHLEINDDLTSLREENENLKALLEKQVDLEEADPCDKTYGTSRMKVILELSTQMSEQSEHIAQLEVSLAEKEQEIVALRGADSTEAKTGNPIHRPPSGSKPRNPSRSDLGGKNSGLSQGSDSGLGGRGRGEEGLGKRGKAGRVGSASSFISDSDSDWDPTGPSSKIHSAPPGCRATTAFNTHKPWLQPTDEDTWSVDGDATTEANYEPEKSHKRSVLKTKQVKERDQRALGLLGPTLAFGSMESPELITPEASSARMDFDTLHGSPMMAPIFTM